MTSRQEEEKKFWAYPIGHFHIDIAEVQVAEGKLRLFVAIDRRPSTPVPTRPSPRSAY